MCLDVAFPLGIAAYAFLFAVATAEATPVVGGFVPGQLVLVASGVLVGAGDLELFPVVVVSVAGAIIGDALGYYAGLRWGRPALMRHGARVGIHAEHVAMGEALFAKHGALAVVLFRFSFVTRAVGPLLAGMMRMDARVFWMMNVLGGVLWSGLFLSLGYALGDTYCRFEDALRPFALATGIGVAVLVAGVAWRSLRKLRLR